MKYRDQCKRHMKLGMGIAILLMICRYRCTACKIIRRILPDDLAPFKHYIMDVITAVIDGDVDSNILEFEAYPCEKTMQRWQGWYDLNKDSIDQKIRSARIRLLAFNLMILYALASSLEILRKTNDSWLSAIFQILSSTGDSLLPFREAGSPG